MPHVVGGRIPIGIENIALSDVARCFGCNGVLLDVSLPEAVFSWFEKGEVDLVAACGLFHLADGNHRSSKGSGLFQDLLDDVLESLPKGLGIVNVVVPSPSIFGRIFKKHVIDGKSERIGNNVLLVIEIGSQVAIIEILGDIVEIVRPIVWVRAWIYPVTVCVAIVSDRRQDRIAILRR